MLQIELEDVKKEIENWKNSVCYILGANPLFSIVDGFVQRIWKDLSIDKVGLIGKGIYTVRFLSRISARKTWTWRGFTFTRNHL